MAIVEPKVDAVIVGMGWTGAIMAKELTDAGLNVVCRERGPDRDTQPDFSCPRVIGELEGSVHRKYLQALSKETVTIRHTANDVAVPYRQMGSFKPGTGAGRAGSHCLNYSKASPTACILPVLRPRKSFALRALAQVMKVNLAADKKKATGVTYLGAQGRDTEQPADLVLLCAFSPFNVHLMLLSVPDRWSGHKETTCTSAP